MSNYLALSRVLLMSGWGQKLDAETHRSRVALPPTLRQIAATLSTVLSCNIVATGSVAARFCARYQWFMFSDCNRGKSRGERWLGFGGRCGE